MPTCSVNPAKSHHPLSTLSQVHDLGRTFIYSLDSPVREHIAVMNRQSSYMENEMTALGETTEHAGLMMDPATWLLTQSDDFSSYQTETSTPASSSLWLPEYTDDENQKSYAKRKQLWPVAETPDTSGLALSSYQPASGKRRRTSGQDMLFACPFAKKDPIQHRRCYMYKLRRVKDVKQHLYRQHCLPSYYCPVCMITFGTAEVRDQHIRGRLCSSCPPSLLKLEGMTESQRQQINKKSTSKDATELQWFAVFDILFPGHHRRPSSPYIEFNLLQDLTLYQGFLETTGSRILSDCVMCQSAIARNLPEEKLDIAHAAFEHTIKEGLRDIFHQWMVPGSGDREEPNIPIEPGGESQLYLPNSCASTQRTDSYAKDPSGGASPNTALSLPEQGTSDTLAGSAALQTASSGQSVANKTSSGDLNFYYDSVDFTSGSTYEDNELVQLINESHSDLPSQSGLG